jgi:hypothetical protein
MRPAHRFSIVRSLSPFLHFTFCILHFTFFDPSPTSFCARAAAEVSVGIPNWAFADYTVDKIKRKRESCSSSFMFKGVSGGPGKLLITQNR